MLKNIHYNLFETITIISQSLYRYNNYIKDAAECPACKQLWSRFREQREKELSMLLKELKSHIDAETIPFE
jgi:glutamyl-tRNA reductase